MWPRSPCKSQLVSYLLGLPGRESVLHKTVGQVIVKKQVEGTYFLIDIDDDIVASVRHGGCAESSENGVEFELSTVLRPDYA